MIAVGCVAHPSATPTAPTARTTSTTAYYARFYLQKGFFSLNTARSLDFTGRDLLSRAGGGAGGASADLAELIRRPSGLPLAG